MTTNAADCDRRTFLLSGLGLAIASELRTPRAPGGPRAAPRHAAITVYTRPCIRPRHRTIVAKALEMRRDAHTSGWKLGPNEQPVLEVGPVTTGAALFHGTKSTGQIARTWPFVVVLEYDARGGPSAFVDWFRRADDSTGAKGWQLDPDALHYVEHMNKELAVDRSGDLGLIALCDTPTGNHVGGSQWVVRGRVDWADGMQVRKGWWLDFDAPATPPDQWRVHQVPLVGWQVRTERAPDGIVATQAVADPLRQLAPLASKDLFTLPDPPPGVTAGR